MRTVHLHTPIRNCLLALLLLPLPLCGQARYANKLLQEMAQQLSDSYGADCGQPGETSIRLFHADTPLVVHCSAEKVTDHIGIRLFAPEMVAEQHTDIFRFAERYLLELLLAETDQLALDRLRLERVKLSSDIPMTGKFRQDLQTIAATFSPRLSYYLSNVGNRYRLQCADGQRNILTLEFPARYELITGYTKPEAENAVYLNLLTYRPAAATTPAESEFREKTPGIYTLNDDYYMMEDIVSTSYYQKEGNSFRPLFSASHPAESVCNLFNAETDHGVTVEITQSLYGNKSNTYEVPLHSLTSYLRSQGCQLYTAIRRMGKEKTHSAWMAVNPELGYQHIFTFTLDRAFFSEPEREPVKVKMFSYVPIHNIASIMEKNK